MNEETQFLIKKFKKNLKKFDFLMKKTKRFFFLIEMNLIFFFLNRLLLKDPTNPQKTP